METENHKTEAAQVTENSASVKVQTFTLKTKTLLQGLNAVKDSSSCDRQRPIISGVNFKVVLYFEENTPPQYRLHLQATDGKRAAQVTLPLDHCQVSEVSPSFIVSNESIEAVLKLLKKSKDLESLTFNFEVPKGPAESVKVEIEKVTSFKSVYGNYPQFGKLLNDIRSDALKYKESLQVTEILKALRELENVKVKTVTEALEKVKASAAYSDLLSREGQLAADQVCTALRKATLKELNSKENLSFIAFTPCQGKFETVLINPYIESVPQCLQSRLKYFNGFKVSTAWATACDLETCLKVNPKYLSDFLSQIEAASRLGIKTEVACFAKARSPLYYRAIGSNGLEYITALMPTY